MARNNLGLPYKGSKNTIASQIVAQFPRAHSFLYACCGGGAVLEAAYLSGKFDRVEGIDIDEGIITLLNAVFHDFGKIDYDPYDVIYFDPPYADTKGYDKAKFDFDRFHSLINGLVESGKAVYVSEYKAPTDRFTEVLAVEKQMSQCDHLTKVVTERLFKGVL